MSVQRSRYRGVSLVEMMIALAIGSFLILGLVRVFSASRTAYQLSEGVSRVQENGRFAVDFIQRDLRMVGHMGCVNDQAHLQNVGALVSSFTGGAAGALATSQGANTSVAFPISLQVYEAQKTTTGAAPTMNLASAPATWSPSLPAAVSGLGTVAGGTTLARPVGGSDVLQMRFLAGEGLPVTAITVSGSTTTITVPQARWNKAFASDGVAAPTMFGLSDCSFVNLFNASATNAGAATNQVTANLALDRFTAQPAGETMLYRIESVVYYVGLNASGTRSLYRARANATGATNTTGTYGAPEELVEGVESIQARIGLDTNVSAMASGGPPSGYVGSFVAPSAVPNTAAGWRSVGAVQLGLLVASSTPAAADAPVANKRVLGTTFTPANPSDRRYRFGYETTVAMRNRLYGN